MTADAPGEVQRRNVRIGTLLMEIGDRRRPYSDHEVRAVGEDHILILSHFHFVGRESAMTLDTEYGAVGRIEDGRIRSASAYLSHAEAERVAAELAGASADA